MKNFSTHPYHLVDVSPWPILMSFALLSGALSLVNWLTLGTNNKIINSIIKQNLFLILINWLKDCVREAKAGYHTSKVQDGLMLGFIIFLITEVMLFVSFFWAMLHSSLSISTELTYWPPLGINAVDYLSLPLLNSVQLLFSGFIATYSHHAFITGNKTMTLFGLIIAMLLTVVFLVVQFIEYSFSEFAISDSVFGSVFYICTGTHFIHVLVAVLFIGVATYRIYSDSVTTEHALNLDMSLIYFHLVDIVWLLVYVIFYVFGS